MQSYFDIRLLPDVEIAPSQLMSLVFSKLHLALVARQCSTVAIAFPGMSASSGTATRGDPKGTERSRKTAPSRPHLGNSLRVIGPHSTISELQNGAWLHNARDHLQMGVVLPVPSNAPHRTLRRVQPKSNPERLRRRTVKRLQQRDGITEDEAQKRVPLATAERVDLPYLYVKSKSTGEQFRLFIRFGDPITMPIVGTFNAYGLSSTATVPWF